MVIFFFFNDTATTEIYTLSLHDALPICDNDQAAQDRRAHAHIRSSLIHGSLCTRGGRRLYSPCPPPGSCVPSWNRIDRKSTRLNSSHANISYAVFCLKKKKKQHHPCCPY